MTVSMAQEYIAGEADAWRLTQDALRRFFEYALTGGAALPDVAPGPRNIVDLSEGEIPQPVRELLGAYLETARLMARRTAELHVTLASDPTDAAFAPEPFTPMYQRSLYQSMRGQVRLAMERLKRRRDALPEALREPADRVLRGEEALLRQARRVLDRITAVRIRCHGDYQLKHLVSIGHDFLVVDFDGEPDRPLSHRRRKRSPVRDLTSLHRSLQEAAESALAGGGLRSEDVPALRPWARFWQRWAAVAFLKEYRAAPERPSCCRATRRSCGCCSTSTGWAGTSSRCCGSWTGRWRKSLWRSRMCLPCWSRRRERHWTKPPRRC